jgi:serine/threonine-protein kinase
MAPEQLAGEPCGVATDVYGLGGLAWEMLTGRTLFSAGSYSSLRDAHLAWRVPDIATVVPGVGGRLRRFLAGSLVADPLARTADLAEAASWAGPLDYAALSAPRR